MDRILALMPAVLALMASPGPVTLASAAMGAAYPRRVAALRVLVMTTGTATVIVMVAIGVTGLVTAIPGAAPVLTLAAAGYILYLAWKIATAPPIARAAAEAPPALTAIYLMAIANPKAWAAMGALFSGFPLIDGAPVLNGVVKAVLLTCFALTINMSWMLAGSALASVLRNPRASRGLNVTMAVLLVLSVAVMLLG